MYIDQLKALHEKLQDAKPAAFSGLAPVQLTASEIEFILGQINYLLKRGRV